MLTWTIFATILTILYVIRFIWSRRKYYELARKLDGVSGSFADYPLVGGTMKFMGKTTKECFHIGVDFCKKMQSPGKFWFGTSLVLLVDEPEDIQTILNSPNCLAKPYVFNFFNLKKGLLSARLRIWKVHRKLLNPSFNLKILKNFVPIFNEKSLKLVKCIETHVGKEEFDMYELMGRCTLDMVCATTLGTNLDIQDDANEYGNKFMHGIDRYTAMVTERIFNFWHHFEILYKRSKSYQMLIDSMNMCWEISQKVIQMKKVELEDPELREKNGGEDFKKPQIYIEQLLQLSKESEHFDESAIKDEVYTIIFGGHETSALTLSHLILVLAIHQDVQDKVVAELREVFYDDNEHPDFDIISKLVYMDMVIKETMRLFPISPFICRINTREINLPTRDLLIPQRVTLVVPVFNVHRDPKFWGPNADAFNPENFTAEKVNSRHPYSYLPFSAGSRNCIGNKYAYVSMRIVLANLLRKYRFTTTLTMETIDLKFDITLKLNHKHLVAVERRINEIK